VPGRVGDTDEDRAPRTRKTATQGDLHGLRLESLRDPAAFEAPLGDRGNVASAPGAVWLGECRCRGEHSLERWVELVCLAYVLAGLTRWGKQLAKQDLSWIEVRQE
jgi:hypothetical protein